MKLHIDEVTGLVLAGGRARRMAGRDKGLIELAGRPMAHWVVQRLVPQTASVLISANRSIERYADFGFEVIRDVDDGFLGPLAGISAGLTQAATPWLVTVPCDSPLLADNLVVRLSAAVPEQGAGIAVAHDGNRLQPVFSLIHRDLAPDLVDFQHTGVIRDVDDGFLGPLAGISAGLTQAATPWLVTVPCDSPLLADNLVVRLSAAVPEKGAGIAVAHDGNRLQPVFSLIHRDLAPDLVDFLHSGGRKIDLWLDRHVWARVDFSDHPEMFLNINTPEELAELEQRLQL